MVSLLLLYAVFNAACVSILVVLAQNPPLVEDDPLPPATIILATNDNAVSTAESEPRPQSVPSRPLRPMHAIA